MIGFREAGLRLTEVFVCLFVFASDLLVGADETKNGKMGIPLKVLEMII